MVLDALSASPTALPVYLWVISVGGVAAISLLTCVLLYGGARSVNLGRGRAGLIAACAAGLFTAWIAGSAVFAAHGGYHTRLGHGVPWLPVVVVGGMTALLTLSRIPIVGRSLAGRGMVSRLLLPHSFRVAGIVLLLAMFLGRLPALFALPAGLGDIAVGIAAPRVGRRLSQGHGQRAAIWFNTMGIIDLIVALAIGTLVGFHLVDVTPSGAAISQLPLVLIPSAAVPLLLALHLMSLRGLVARRLPISTAVASREWPCTS
jgi:hypothetical protein